MTDHRLTPILKEEAEGHMKAKNPKAKTLGSLSFHPFGNQASRFSTGPMALRPKITLGLPFSTGNPNCRLQVYHIKIAKKRGQALFY